MSFRDQNGVFQFDHKLNFWQSIKKRIKLVIPTFSIKVIIMYYFKCNISQFHLYFLSSQVTHNNIFLLRETQNALHLHAFFSFFSFFCQPYLKYWWTWSKKIFYRPLNSWTANAIQLFVHLERKFFRTLLFQNKSQRRGIPLGLLDNFSHLFICLSLKWPLSSGQKPV